MKNRSQQWLARAAFALVLAMGPAAEATVVERMALAQQVDAAELIFVGRAVAEETALSEDGISPYTFVTFEVERVLKGSTEGSELTLRLAGGATERGTVEVEGMPTFEDAGRYLLFVSGNGEWGCPVLGWGQGKLAFRDDPELGREVLENEAGEPLLGVEGSEWMRGTPRARGATPADAKADARFAVDALDSFVRGRGHERTFRPASRPTRSADRRGRLPGMAGELTAPPAH